MSEFFRIILLPLSLFYRIIIYFWNIYWRQAKKVKLSCKVISVGNIVAGGTGKTPLVIYLANLASKSGFKTAVIARGYRREGRGLIEMNDRTNWLDAGDEPVEIYRQTENVEVYVCESKTKAALQAETDGAEIIIVDDGFQHRRLARNIDIVCLDWSRPLGSGGYLPSGFLREPPSSLNRADVIVHSSYRKTSKPENHIKNFPKSPKQFYSSTKINGFVDIKTGEIMSIENMNRKKPVAFCGIASPGKFSDTLNDSGITPVKSITFGDHHKYTSRDINNLKQIASRFKTDIFITTAKDAVKIEGFNFDNFDIYFARLEIDIVDKSGNSQVDEFKRTLSL